MRYRPTPDEFTNPSLMDALTETDQISPLFTERRRTASSGILDRVIRLSCSVRLGVTLLILLIAFSMIGMAVMQQNVAGFANYYAGLYPWQQSLYARLGLFDIYHSWYYNLLLSALSLNLILATADRLPKVWPYFKKPAAAVPMRWLTSLPNAGVIETSAVPDTAESLVIAEFGAAGFAPTTAVRNGRKFVFAQKGVWNRFAFAAVHAGLLLILFGGFLTAQFGSVGTLSLAPGESSDLMFDTGFKADSMVEISKRLPFRLTAVDIRQRLIRPAGPITADNTLDWVTQFTIADETGVRSAAVQINQPYDYRGYRFFQGAAGTRGRARSVVLEAHRAAGGAVERAEITRDGTARLSSGAELRLAGFRGNYHSRPEAPAEDTSSYPNPAALIEVTTADGVEMTPVFPGGVGDAPIAGRPTGGYTFKMLDFERVADRHELFIQRDPGVNFVYAGFAILAAALGAVFFFSHRRLWAVIEPAQVGSRVTLAGHANRNTLAFDEKLKMLGGKLSRALRSGPGSGD
ncbi:MAG TPA: cytochrome c biogenesis protein ResB [Pyrinomonadaceae bacterium]|nr:cytochrome c biogenesis protein ResB [Pyrinomonadaceae bacterium]